MDSHLPRALGTRWRRTRRDKTLRSEERHTLPLLPGWQWPWPEAGTWRLMLVSYWQHEWDEATQNQGRHFQAAEASPSSAVGFVAVSHSTHLREDMDGGNIKKCPRREEHGHSSGIDLWKGFFTALWIRRDNKEKSHIRVGDRRMSQLNQNIYTWCCLVHGGILRLETLSFMGRSQIKA